MPGKSATPFAWVPSASISMGIVYVMLTSASAIMFKDLGLANSQAAVYASILTLPYAIKAAYSPIVEIFKSKRYFAVSAQALIAVFFGLGYAATYLHDHLIGCLVSIFAAIAVAGSIQDIAVDGTYVTCLEHPTQSLFAGIQSLSWNIGQIVTSGGIVYLSGLIYSHLQSAGQNSLNWTLAWRYCLLLLAAFYVASALWHARSLPDNSSTSSSRTFQEAKLLFVEAFSSFLAKPGILRMIGFCFFFQLPLGLLDKIVPFFLVDPRGVGGLGMSNQTLGITYGTYGFLGLLLGAFLAGLFVARVGIQKAMLPMCCAINIPNITFLLLALYRPESLPVSVMAIIAERFFVGFGVIGFLLYTMQQVAPGKFATAHLAFASGIKGLCMMLAGMLSGVLQDLVGYQWFFLIVILASVPSFWVTVRAPYSNNIMLASMA